MKFLSILYLICCSQIAIAANTLSVQQVAPGIYVHLSHVELADTGNHGEIANIGFIVGDRCVAVIDTGGNPEQGKALKKAIETTTTKPVCFVINTHVHPDHIYGNAAFKGPGVKFVGHKNLSRAMSTRGPFYLDKAQEQLGIRLSAGDIIPPDIAVEASQEIDLGGRILTLTAHPAAHTDNDLTVFDRNTNTIWLADLLFIEHLPVIDGSLKGWLTVLSSLEHNSYKLIIPGHGPVVTDWPQAMKPEKDYLQMLLTDLRSFIKTGGHLEQAVETIGYSAQGNWKLFEQFHRKNVTTAFAELEWED
jgi:quinoprotein relay system zinc metallohydrolase 2